jgi:C4-dicarboxylate-specific signal transduction histidine kinase
VYFYFGLGTYAKNALVEQMLHREQANVRAGASAMGTFFKLVGNSAVRISSRDEVITPSSETDGVFTRFIYQWGQDSPVTSIILVDKTGKVIKAAYSELEGQVGISVADRDYFVWAKDAPAGEFHISGAIISRLRQGENYYVVPVASPVIDENGEFKGVLVVGVSLNRLTEQYLNHLKISDNTEIHLVNKDGTFLYTSFKELLGKNLFEYIQSHPFLGSEALVTEIKKRMADRREGKALVAYPTVAGQALPLKARMLAYGPVFIEGHDWILVIATPVEDALISMGPFYIRFVIGMAVAFLLLLALGIRLAKIQAYREAAKVKK